MTTRTVERVDDWETTPFTGGYDGLRELASDEFSGVVTAGPARLCMLRGTVVGVLDGSIDDFVGADGTARRAPHHALPLLTYMQGVSDEVRAKYYSEDTPLSEVDRTLSEGTFTGYVELAENVLSGDYFQVYHQGRSMSVAFVGSSNRLLTDDEAFETADDEVGIYEVRPVEFEPIEIPGGEGGAGGTTAVGADPGAGAGTGADGDAVAGRDRTDAGGTDGRGDTSSSTGAETEGSDVRSAATDDRGADTRGDRTDRNGPTDRGEPSDNGHAAEGKGSPGRDRDTAQTGGAGGTGNERDGNAARSSREDVGDTGSSGERHGREAGASSPATGGETHTDSVAETPASSGTDRSAGGAEAPESDSVDRSEGEPTGEGGGVAPGDSVADAATDLETRSIPSLDPGRSRSSVGGGDRPDAGGAPPGSKTAAGTGRPNSGDTEAPGASGSEVQGHAGDETEAPGDAGTTGDPSARETERAGGEVGRSGQVDAEPTRSDTGEEAAAGGRSETAGRVGTDHPQSGRTDAPAGGRSDGEEAARDRIEDHEAAVKELERELEALTEERDDLAVQRDRLQSELDEARAEIERLEARIAEADEAGATAGGTQLTPDRAVDETNLFVRYDSKGEATLEKAHGGTVDRAAVSENLRLEHHTQFDAADATVGGTPFDDYLAGTIQYRFVEWLVTSLLWEIRDTGHVDGMKDLYDALPKIDRAELNGQVSVQFEDEGETHRTQETFDVVVRDRMGNPLVVANINDSRDPATDSMMTDLVKTSQRVGESSSSLAGAVLVTKSFFQPESLETAEEAASSGLFSRDKRESFVNLSRKAGFHLCLVEARNDEIHLTVPEL